MDEHHQEYGRIFYERVAALGGSGILQGPREDDGDYIARLQGEVDDLRHEIEERQAIQSEPRIYGGE